MTLTIGTRTPSKSDGSWAEVRLFDDAFANCDLVVQNSAIENLTVKDSAGGVPFCEASLRPAERKVGLLFRQNAGVEIWVCGGQRRDPILLMRGKIDFVERRRDMPADPFQIQFQARSSMSNLIDEGFEGEHEGPLEDLVRRICGTHTVVVDSHSNSLSAYVSAASSYAALRLLAVSLSAIVHVDRDASIAFRDRDLELKRLSLRPVGTIDMDVATNVRVTQGVPVRHD